MIIHDLRELVAALEAVDTETGISARHGQLRVSRSLVDLLMALEPAKPFDALTIALARHMAAAAAVDSHHGDDDVPQTIVYEEAKALDALAALPCEGAELDTKLRYMLDVQKSDFGELWEHSPAAEILRALDLHLNGKAAA